MLLMMLLLAVPERASLKTPTEVVLLPIPDRRWAEGAPDEGWCAETSIQMIALHYGAWVPQPVINSLGRSTHVDLWENDVPTALRKLGLAFEVAQVGTREEFIGWVIAQLRLGRPVIAGAKLFPTAHPDWDVDHLMPIVGFSPRGLTFNTNLDQGQLEVPYAALGGKRGISFLGPTGKFYGYAVRGFGDAKRSQLRVLKETNESVQLAAQVEGEAWQVRREELDGGTSTTPLTDVLEVRPRETTRLRLISR